MRSSYTGLLGGLGFAWCLCTCSSGEFSVLAGSARHHHRAPGGAGWHRDLSVPHAYNSERSRFDGLIMCMGVATANSILVVAFAKERLEHHGDPRQAAIEAGYARFRPVLMTALAMIIGMIPMRWARRWWRAECAAGTRRHRRPLLRTIATLIFVRQSLVLLHGRRVGQASRPVN